MGYTLLKHDKEYIIFKIIKSTYYCLYKLKCCNFDMCDVISSSSSIPIEDIKIFFKKLKFYLQQHIPYLFTKNFQILSVWVVTLNSFLSLVTGRWPNFQAQITHFFISLSFGKDNLCTIRWGSRPLEESLYIRSIFLV